MVLNRCTTLSEEDFLTDVFNRKPLYTRAEDLQSDFSDLFSAEVLEDLLANSAIRTSSVRLVRAGVEFDVTRGTVADSGDLAGSAPFVSTETIRAGLASGHTLLMRSLHRYHPPLRRFAHALSAQLGHPVRVNAFITPPNSQGVSLHYDVQDVLVLQIAGEKHWELRAQPLSAPLAPQAWFDVPQRKRDELKAASTLLADLVLRPGDTLYFPRGTMHSPRTEDSLSIHLTISIPQVTHHDLLQAMVDDALEDEWVRGSVSLARLEAGPELARVVLLAIAQRLSDVARDVSTEELLWRVRAARFAELPAEPVPVLPVVEPAQTHRLRTGAKYRVVPDGDSVSLQGVGRRVTLPAAAAPVLDELRDTGTLDRERLAEQLSAPLADQLVQVLTDFGLITGVRA
ncbi:cupin domain-containing protein [Lentzea sp. NPDC051838]|uniref:cupin domain-containing protein n=1 Tax=Lentzea sp. NPDC051838 TaxID=3154849 RepID=UPI003434ADF2